MSKSLFYIRCIALGLLFLTVLGVVTMYLWNWLVPMLFHGPVISYWQALGLLVLSKILFSGFGGGKRNPCGEEAPYWKQRFNEKFSSMSEEQREEFKRKMKEKWCRFERDASDSQSDTSKDA